MAFGLGITVLGTLFLDPLMRVLGATPTILPDARDYARYILFGAPIKMCIRDREWDIKAGLTADPDTGRDTPFEGVDLSLIHI